MQTNVFTNMQIPVIVIPCFFPSVVLATRELFLLPPLRPPSKCVEKASAPEHKEWAEWSFLERWELWTSSYPEEPSNRERDFLRDSRRCHHHVEEKQDSPASLVKNAAAVTVALIGLLASFLFVSCLKRN